MKKLRYSNIQALIMTTKGALQFENIGDEEQGTQNFTLLQNFGKIPSQMQSSFEKKIANFQKKKEKS